MSGVLAVTQPFGVGLGIQEPFRIAAPGADTNAIYQADGYGLRRLLSLVFTLTTDSNAANRYVTVEYQGKDGLAFVVNAAAVTVAASSTQRFAGSYGRGEAEWAANTDVLFPVTPVILSPGDVLKIVVTNIQAGDTLTAIRGVMERFPLDIANLPTMEP